MPFYPVRASAATAFRWTRSTGRFKVNDIRESPAIAIVELLAGRGAQVSDADSFTPQLSLDRLEWASGPSAKALGADRLLSFTTGGPGERLRGSRIRGPR